MTRGTLYLITKDKVYSSIERNGDMYPEGLGDEVFEKLRKVNSLESFKKLCKSFMGEYKGQVVWERELKKSSQLNFKNDIIEEDDIMSDYNFIKNISGKTLKINGKKENYLILRNGETGRFYFSKIPIETIQIEVSDVNLSKKTIKEVEKEINDILRKNKNLKESVVYERIIKNAGLLRD